MSSDHSNSAQDKPKSMKMLGAMVTIGVLCALLIVLTFEQTKEVIARKKAEALEKAVFKVLPGCEEIITFRLVPDKEIVAVDQLEKENASSPEQESAGKLVYAGYNSRDELVGVAIEAAGQGYADIIRILYGYVPDKEAVVGFYVLESRETPGLGDKIEKDDAFLENFRALDVTVNDQGELVHDVVTVKHGEKEHSWQIDAITGATISSRAIGDIMKASTEKWVPFIKANLDQLRKKKESVQKDSA